MFDHLLQLVILFLVIFDPLASAIVFLAATKNIKDAEKGKIATLAILVACVVSFTVLIFGQQILILFNTDINDFRIAGGIILVILGVKMGLGQSITDTEKFNNGSARAIASIIATPLLTGPAAITAIIINSFDYGLIETGLAVAIVLALTGIIFYTAAKIAKRIGMTTIQVTSTILGLITLAWGVTFIRAGLGI